MNKQGSINTPLPQATKQTTGEKTMGLLHPNSVLPQHQIDDEQQLRIRLDICRWLELQGLDNNLVYNLFPLAYARRLESNSDEPIVKNLIQLAKEIALELDERDELLTLLD